MVLSLSPLLFYFLFFFPVMIAGLFYVNILGDTTNFYVTFTGNRNILLKVYLLSWCSVMFSCGSMFLGFSWNASNLFRM